MLHPLGICRLPRGVDSKISPLVAHVSKRALRDKTTASAALPKVLRLCCSRATPLMSSGTGEISPLPLRNNPRAWTMTVETQVPYRSIRNQIAIKRNRGKTSVFPENSTVWTVECDAAGGVVCRQEFHRFKEITASNVP